MRSRWLGFAIAALAAMVSALFYGRLPPQVASHWDLHGTPDDWTSRTTAVVLIPLVLLGASLLMQVLPGLDPRRRNDPGFRASFWLVVNTMLLFILVLHAALLANGVGAPVNPARVFVVGFGILMIVLGIVLRRLEPNWFLGIRTPWTLESETVWRTTHRVGGIAFIMAGVLTLVTAWMRVRSLLVGVVAVMVAAVGSALLSLLLWLRERNGGVR